MSFLTRHSSPAFSTSLPQAGLPCPAPSGDRLQGAARELLGEQH